MHSYIRSFTLVIVILINDAGKLSIVNFELEKPSLNSCVLLTSEFCY